MERAKAWEAGTRLSTGSKLWNAERAKAWEAGSRRSERGREGRAAAPGPGARPPTYKRTCHIVTVNASGGQINDKSNALEEKREEEEREAEVPVPTANCAPKNAFGSPSRALLGEIVSYRPDGSAHALPEDSALGGLLDCQADAEASIVNGLVGRCRMSNAEDWAARM